MDAIKPDIVLGVDILVCQRFVCVNDFQIFRDQRIGNGRIQAGFQRHGQEGPVQELPFGQAEGNVAHTQDGLYSEFLFDHADRFQSFHPCALLRGNGQSQTVDKDSFPAYTVALGRFNDPFGDFEPLLRILRQTPFVQRQGDHACSVLFNDREYRFHTFLLAVHRVDDGLSVIVPGRGLDDPRICAVDLKRSAHIGDLFHDLDHHFKLVDIGQSYIEVEDICAGFHLAHRFFSYIRKVPCF